MLSKKARQEANCRHFAESGIRPETDGRLRSLISAGSPLNAVRRLRNNLSGLRKRMIFCESWSMPARQLM